MKSRFFSKVLGVLIATHGFITYAEAAERNIGAVKVDYNLIHSPTMDDLYVRVSLHDADTGKELKKWEIITDQMEKKGILLEKNVSIGDSIKQVFYTVEIQAKREGQPRGPSSVVSCFVIKKDFKIPVMYKKTEGVHSYSEAGNLLRSTRLYVKDLRTPRFSTPGLNHIGRCIVNYK